MIYFKALLSCILLLALSAQSLASNTQENRDSKPEKTQKQQSLEDQIAAMQGDIAALRQQQSMASNVLFSEDSSLKRLRINAFATAAISASDSSNYSYLKFSNNNISDKANTTSDSRMGLQLSFFANEKMDFVTQLLAEAKNRWQLEASWAYLQYRIDENWSIRAGKMRLPYYLASEYIDIGYAYPWIRPPAELYSVFIENYTGIEFSHHITFANGWVNQSKVFFGNTLDGERGDVLGDDDFDFSLQKLWGIEERLSYGAVTFRASYTQGEFELEVPNFVSLNNKDYRYIVVGAAYDSTDFMLSVEQAYSKIDDYTKNTPFSMTFGYHIGDFLPYLTFSSIDDEDQVFGDSRQKSWTLGGRYYVNEYIALKASAQHFYDFDGTTGQFSRSNQAVNEPIESHINIISFSIESVF